jgi:hypothetical protein
LGRVKRRRGSRKSFCCGSWRGEGVNVRSGPVCSTNDVGKIPRYSMKCNGEDRTNI